MKAFSLFCVLSLFFSSVLGNGEFTILHSPNGINFRGNDPLNTIELPKVLSTAIGHTTFTDDVWDGLSILNPFNYPNVAIVVGVTGVPSLKLAEPKYALRATSSLEQVKEDLALTLGKVVLDENDLFSGETSDKVAFKTMSNTDGVAQEFLKDLAVVRDLKQKAITKYLLQTVWIQLGGLDKIVREFGTDSPQATEATSLLRSEIDGLSDALEKVYGDRYLLSLVTDDGRHFRTKRNVKEETQPNNNLNLSKQYRDDYAVIFNIILWTSIFVIAALISTAIFICTLDPGRDSIIYRMTTQRIKKEN